jgi:hypothetical protein
MISFSVNNNDKYSKEEFAIIDNMANEFFDTKNDNEQLPGEEIDFDMTTKKYPNSLNIIKKDNKVIGYTFALPCRTKIMKSFLEKKINEREMYEKIKKENIDWKNAECIYFAGAQTIKEYQKQGIGNKARIAQIKKLQEINPNLKKLFCWTYTKEGMKLVNKVQKILKQEILIRN